MTLLSELCELIIDCEHKTAPTVSSGFPLIRTPNIGLGRLDIDGALRVDEVTYRAWTKRAVPIAGDLILAREAPVGNVGPVLPGMQPVLGQRTVLIRSRPDILDPMYLNYLLSAPRLRSWMHGVASGATVPHLNMSDIRAMPLPPLPSITAQRKIAAILSAYDDLIENNNRRIGILEEIARRVYREWFVDLRYPGHADVRMVDSEHGLSSQGWGQGTLEDLVVLQRGFDLPRDQRASGDVPVIAATGRHGSHSSAKVLGPGVVTGRSGSLGHVEYVAEDFWPLNTTLWVKEFRHATPEFAYYMLQDLNLAQYNSGAAVATLNRNDIKGLVHRLPPVGLVRAFSELAKSGLELQRRYRGASDVARAARDLLLRRLVSGELEVDAPVQVPVSAS
jgi:type I restriction enzyme, S subunit